ncbi:TPA: hypothetical protein PNM84_001333 [Listeria monocytogenes]|nr:hypothetical protein [Listeria monocytogenes]HAA9071012.1 hypothetical protein [Listeria monocytogenes]HDI4828565.1 hypothetical protein [Listeria monocytogenes]HDM9928146.1 hypothetical protein [Listeria monocytogenes]
MAQPINQISLYRKMTDDLLGEVGIYISAPEFKYMYEKNEKEILLNESFDGILTINEYDSMWSPNENNLEMSQLFRFENPSALFGESGVTMSNNKIGLAVHLHSKTSNFQKTLNVGTILNTEEPIEIRFYHHFPPASLRGDIQLDFFLYLKENVENFHQHASKVGMILSEGDIENIEIITDGDGSAFPMSEFEDKSGPLWRLEKNWVEANLDTFDSSNVNLSLNTAHPLFRQIKDGKTAVSRALMGDIMIQAMSLIIQEVILIEKNSIEDTTDALPESILMAVQYWVSSFEIDLSSLFSITNSIRLHWDRQMFEGDGIND